MARNAEKSQSMLYRFHASKAADLGIIDAGRTRRPKVITSVDSIPICEKWRGQVLKEISRKVMKIQDESLSDFQIRDLNDEINKLMREKWVWERQIRNLGGPNYMRGGGPVTDSQGREIAGGGKGYRYYGRAQQLPGVKELFEAAAQKAKAERDGSTKGDREVDEMARKQVDAAYYGWGRDYEDETLLAYEASKEAELERAFHAQESGEDSDLESLPGDTGDGVRWRLPTLEEVQEELLERKKQRLVDSLGV